MQWGGGTRQIGKQHLGAVAALTYEILGTPLFHVLFSKGVTWETPHIELLPREQGELREGT
jgi:hypothetical protein